MVKEVEIGKILVEWLIGTGYEVFQEVKIGHADRIVDVVAKKINFLWAIELKTCRNLEVINQASKLKSYSNKVSVAIPVLRKDDGYSFWCSILEWQNIGLLEIHRFTESEKKWGLSPVKEIIVPMLVDSPELGLRLQERLFENQKDFAEAGNSKSKYWSPFQETKKQIIETVKSNPGLSVKELVFRIKHHYETDERASSAILTWIRNGVIGGISIKKVKNRCYLYPKLLEKKDG